MLNFVFTILAFNPELNHPTGIKYQNATQSTEVSTINQYSTVNPQDSNPLDYENKIENTIYQSGDRLIIIQSIPLKYINEATKPNIQPTITDYPSL